MKESHELYISFELAKPTPRDETTALLGVDITLHGDETSAL
jgi:hypothetical protein